jgi:hypothetical protein
MLGKLNYKYHIMSFTSTVFNIMVPCTISVLQFLLVPQMKQESKKYMLSST